MRTTWKPDKEIKRLVGCSLPKAKDIHDAIAAGEFHKVDGVVLSQLIGDFIIDAIDKSQASTVPKPILQALLDRGVIVPRT